MTIRLCAFADEADSNLIKQAAALKHNSISLIELRNINGVNISKISEEEAESYAEFLKKNGIKVWSIGSPLGKIKIDEDFDTHLKLTKHIIKLAKIFETDNVRVFSFYLEDHSSYREMVIYRLNKMNEIAYNNGIQFFNENEKGLYCNLARYAVDVLDNVKGLKNIFDPANYIQCGQDIDEAIDMLFDRTSYFHIKDAIKGNGEVVPAGGGDGKIEKIIKKISTNTVLSIEPHLKVFSGLKDIDNNELKNKYTYKTNGEAFDVAVSALKTLLKNAGFIEKEGGVWIK